MGVGGQSQGLGMPHLQVGQWPLWLPAQHRCEPGAQHCVASRTHRSIAGRLLWGEL